MEDTADGKPKYVDQSSVEGDASANVYGVSVDEMAGQGGKLAHPGWVKRTEGTGGRAGRVFQEVLVASSSMKSASVTDAADDEITVDGVTKPAYPDTVVTIDTQPIAASVAAGEDATFTVVASTTQGTLTYQWQEDSGSGFKNMRGQKADTLTLTAVSADMTGYEYKCIVKVDSVEVASNEVALTVT